MEAIIYCGFCCLLRARPILEGNLEMSTDKTIENKTAIERLEALLNEKDVELEELREAAVLRTGVGTSG